MADLTYGLLTPHDILRQGMGLLHTPDVLMQGLLAGMRPVGGAVRHPIGGERVLTKPLEEMQFTRVPEGVLAARKAISPEALLGGTLIPGVGDRSAAALRLTDVGGRPVSTLLHGGGGYMRTPEGGVWASELGPSTTLSKRIERAAQNGPVYLTHAVMNPRAIDFQHAVSDQILQVLPQSQISRAAKQAFKERMFEGVVDGGKQIKFTDFPGIDSPKLRSWLDESGNNRKWFVKLMDQTRFEKQGFPNIPEMRLAATAKGQVDLPEFASGAEISRVLPGTMSGTGHPSFPVGTPGQYVGGFGGYLPKELMFPDWYKANVGVSQNLRRSFQLGDVSQPLNQQWLDRIMPLYEKGLLLTGR